MKSARARSRSACMALPPADPPSPVRQDATICPEEREIFPDPGVLFRRELPAQTGPGEGPMFIGRGASDAMMGGCEVHEAVGLGVAELNGGRGRRRSARGFGFRASPAAWRQRT